MQQIKVSEAVASRRRIPLFLFDDDSADFYAPKTGLTFTAAEIRISKNGAAEANSTGTVTEVAGGVYYYEATAAELDTVGFISVRPVKTDVYGAPSVAQVIALNLYDSSGGGLTYLDATVSSRLPTATYEGADAILDKANGVETGITLRQALRLLASVIGGRTTGSRTGVVVTRNLADTKNVVTATIDSSGNRTALTRDLT